MAAASLDIMNDVVLKFGHMLGNEQTQLKSILLQGLVDPKPVIRKRAVNCLGMPTIHNGFQKAVGPIVHATVVKADLCHSALACQTAEN